MPLDVDNISPSPMSAPISGKVEQVPFEVAPPPQMRLRAMFDDSRTQSNTNRMQAQVWRDYYDGPRQLNSGVRTTLRMRGQPAIWTNRVQPAVDGILGVLEGSKVDPRAYPRNKDDEEAADVATKTLRYIADVSDLENTLLDCAENFLIEGIEAVIVEAEGSDIPITQIRYEEFFYDPFSRRNDFKDAKYMGIAQWKDCADVKAAWPEQYKAMGDPMTGAVGPNGALDSTWQDRPDNLIPWTDPRRQRIMVVEVYYNETRAPFAGPQWYHCIYCAAGVFVHEVSQYKDVINGMTLNPIEAESCYVDRENNRYGRIQNMIPIQDEINARRSRLLHLANSRQIQEVTPGSAQVDATTARKEAARADGVIPSGWQLVPTVDIARGQAELLAESKSEIERMGPTPAVLSQQGGDRSGRASLVLQQAGMTELARPLGRHNDFRQRIYRQAWQRAQQFWTAPMWIRVTDDTKAPEFLQINEPAFDDMGQPIPEVDPRTGQPVLQPVTGPDGQPVVDPSTGQPAMQMVQKVNNRLATLDMDILVTTAPDTANLQQEVFAELMGIVEKVGLQAVFSPEFALILEMTPLQNKAEILERIKQAQGGEDPRLAAAQQIIEQLQAQVAELTQGMAAAEQENKQADTAKKAAEVELTEAKTALTEVQALVAGFEAGQDSVPEPPEPAPQKS